MKFKKIIEIYISYDSSFSSRTGFRVRVRVRVRMGNTKNNDEIWQAHLNTRELCTSLYHRDPNFEGNRMVNSNWADDPAFRR